MQQLHQQPGSWLYQQQAKIHCCRLGHQSTLLDISNMTGAALWGMPTDAFLMNGLP